MNAVRSLTQSLGNAVTVAGKTIGQSAGNVTVGTANLLFNYFGPIFAILALVLIVALIALASSNSKGTSLAQRKAPEAVKPAPTVPTLQPKSAGRPAPLIVRSSAPEPSKPVMQPKSVEVVVAPPVAPVVVAEPEPVAEVVAEPAVADIPVAPEEPAEIPVEKALDSTFEAYRKAMLSTGPRRQLEENVRAEMQMKHSMGNNRAWRNQVSSLRKNFKNQESLQDYLENSGASINDRMVAMFEAVEA